MRGGVQKQIVRNKPLISARQFLLLNDRMPAFNNLQVTSIDKFRTAVIAHGRDVTEGCEDIGFRQSKRALPDTPGFRGYRRPQFRRVAALDLDDLRVRVEKLRFIFLKLAPR